MGYASGVTLYFLNTTDMTPQKNITVFKQTYYFSASRAYIHLVYLESENRYVICNTAGLRRFTGTYVTGLALHVSIPYVKGKRQAAIDEITRFLVK